MDNTWYLGWKPVLKKSDSWERSVLLAIERYAEAQVLQTEVNRLCDASDLGIVDCADLGVECKLGRWARRRRRLYVECSCLFSPSGKRVTWRGRSKQRR